MSDERLGGRPGSCTSKNRDWLKFSADCFDLFDGSCILFVYGLSFECVSIRGRVEEIGYLYAYPASDFLKVILVSGCNAIRRR